MKTDYYHRLPYHPWLLALVAIVVLAWQLGGIPIVSHNEARRMVVAQEILQSGHWLLPRLNDELYITKPPLYSWIQAVLALVFGDHPAILRMPSVFFALACLVVLYRWLQRHALIHAAPLAVLILLSSPLFVFHARFAEIEIMLAFFNAAALFWYFDYLHTQKRFFLYLAFAALGFAFMSKGPVALLFFIPPIALYSLFFQKSAYRGLIDLKAWLLFMSIGLPWYIYVYVNVDFSVIQAVLQRDIAGKVNPDKSTHFYKYLLTLLGGFFPWIFLLAKRSAKTIKQSPLEAWLLAGVLTPVVIFSFFGAKHDKYILPVFPVLAAWLGVVLQDWLKKKPRMQKLSLGIFALWMSGLLIFHWWVAPKIWQHRYQALPQIATFAKQHQSPLFALQVPATQLAYYYRRPIPVLDESQLQTLLHGQQKILVLADERHWSTAQSLGLCTLGEWRPYLKRKRGVRIYTPCPLPRQIHHRLRK